jgi:hypothetical protein
MSRVLSVIYKSKVFVSERSWLQLGMRMFLDNG